MNKKIASELAVGIILLIAIILGTVVYFSKDVKRDIIENITVVPEKGDSKCDYSKLHLEYSVIGGWGFKNTITINNNGVAEYVNTDVLGDITKKTIQLSDEEIGEMKKLVCKESVLSFQDEYTCLSNCPLDSSLTTIKFTIDGEKKEISISIDQNMPEELKNILEEIKNIEKLFIKI